MRTAVLNQTRDSFGIQDGSIFAAIQAPFRRQLAPITPMKELAPVNDNKAPRPPRKSHYWALSALLAPAALGMTYEPWKQMDGHSLPAQHVAADPLRSVTVSQPTRTATSSVVVPATFRPWQSATLNARVNGYLAAWHFDLGGHVKAGDLMAEIDTPELDQELATAKALVNEAIAGASQARAERVEAEADLKVAEAQLVRIQAELTHARSQLVRRKELLAKKVTTQEEYDTFATQVATRDADAASTESDILRRRSNLETRTAIIESRDATVKSRQANVDRLEELQGFKRIVAPFDGIVTRRTAEVGMLVTAGEGAMFDIQDLDRIRVQMNVPQTYAASTRPGVSATIRIPESSLPPVSAQITRISNTVDAVSRTMVAEIELENGSQRLQPGIYAQVTLTTEETGNRWTIPANAVSMRVDGPHVAVVNDSDEIEIRRVSLGRDMGNRVAIVDGIRGDEKLVLNPSDDLVQGTRVQIRQ